MARLTTSGFTAKNLSSRIFWELWGRLGVRTWPVGFAFAAYLPLIVAMVVAGFAGTAIGSHLLVRVPEHIFRVGFKIVLTLVALDLLREALF